MKIGRQKGIEKFAENIEIPIDIAEFSTLIKKLSKELIISLIPGCYVRQNDNDFSIRFEGEIFDMIKMLEDSIHIYKFPSPRIAHVLLELNIAISGFHDTRIRNGKRYIYIPLDLDSMYLRHQRVLSNSLAGVMNMGVVLDKLKQCHDELSGDIQAFIQKKKDKLAELQKMQREIAERKKTQIVEAVRIQPIPTPEPKTLINSLIDQLSTKTMTMQERLNQVLAKNTGKTATADTRLSTIRKWVQIGDTVRIIVKTGPNLRNRDYYIYPPEVELDIPAGYRQHLGVDRIEIILTEPDPRHDTVVKTNSKLHCNFNEEHWMPLKNLYENEVKNNEPGFYYKKNGSFVVVDEKKREFPFKNYESAVELINMTGLGFDITKVMVYENPSVIADVGEES